jgi:hypothetical protein
MTRPRFAHLRVIAAVLTLAASAVTSRPVLAQVATGSIVGTVVDSSGQVVPGAPVAIRNVNQNITTTLVTDQEGGYSALFLVPGTYEVHIALQGFKAWTRSGIVLQVNDRLRIDAKLERTIVRSLRGQALRLRRGDTLRSLGRTARGAVLTFVGDDLRPSSR